MPSKYTVKTYIENSFYHIYNRGVEKRNIFLDDQDYHVILQYLKEAFSPPPDPKTLLKNVSFKGSTFKGIPRQVKNFSTDIDLVAYCLIPNHFHFLIKQYNKYAIKQFMQSLTTRYSMYFNKKYSRVGALFQGIYKAILVSEEPYLLHLTRYIHRNPLKHTKILHSAYSSYGEFLGVRKTKWIKPAEILSFFNNSKTSLSITKKTNSYKSFVEDEDIESENYLGKTILENTL